MTAPTGETGLARQYLRSGLADSASFRTWCGAANQAAALAHIFYDALPLPAANAEIYSAAEITARWPYAVIYVIDSARTRDAHDTFRAGGIFGVQLCQEVAAGDVAQPDEIAVKLLNAVEGMIQDLEALIHTNGYLDFDEVAIAGPPRRAHPDDVAGGLDEIELDLTVSWGGDE